MGDKSDYDVDVQVLSCCNGQLYGMVDVPAMGTVKPWEMQHISEAYAYQFKCTLHLAIVTCWTVHLHDLIVLLPLGLVEIKEIDCHRIVTS